MSTLIPVSSSCIAAVGYDPFTQTLTLEFHSGRTNDYHNVPYSVYMELMNAPSIGAYYNRWIKGRYP